MSRTDSTPPGDPGDDPRMQPTAAGGGLDEDSVPETGALLERALGSAATPEEVGPYRILGVLGEGGMGVVYRAEQQEPVKRAVALKLIRSGEDSREIVARFESERQALALMTHPGIARIFDAGTTPDGRPYFVMEYVDGTPITSYCDEKRLALRERLHLFTKVCDAIQHAHHKAIIHRDLKPSNILVAEVDGEPTPKVIDFGIAKAVDQKLSEHTLQTRVGQIMGTLEYMSPEQTGFDELDVDTRTDVYSLGVVLYELATGTLPFDASYLRREGIVGFLRIIQEEDPPRPSTRLTHSLPQEAGRAARAERTSRLRAVRGDLDWIVLKALEKDRRRRYASVSELAADVRRHLALEPVLARPPSALYRCVKFARRHRAQVIGVAAVLVVAALFAAGTWLRALGDARSLLAVGEEKVRQLAAARLVTTAYTDWLEAKQRHDWGDPVWERRDEIEARQRWERHLRTLSSHYDEARGSFLSALELAPWGSGERRRIRAALARLELERLRQVRQQGFARIGESDVERHLRAMFPRLDTVFPPEVVEEIEAGGTIELATEPPGAVVYCFRYEAHDEHLVPIPFRPAGRKERDPLSAPGPFLRIEHVFDARRSPFRGGDRFVTVRGAAVRTRGHLARALEEVGPEEPIGVRVERDGVPTDLEWIPYPADRRDFAGRVPDVRLLFSFTFEGYPLELHAGTSVGSTAADAPLRLELPRGSYLLVVTRPGHEATRYPVSIPADNGPHYVRLLRNDRVPPGFVHVPAGRFTAGGDEWAFRSRAADSKVRVDDFLIARSELTLGEYLDFVNGCGLGLDEHGRALPSKLKARPYDVPGLEKALEHRSDLVQIVPFVEDRRGRNVLLYRRAEGTWELNRGVRGLRAEWPVMGVPLLAALEYCHWRSEVEGGRRRFRLPQELEWEKAARGVDGRPYVWGEHFYWTFCARKGRALPIDLFPLDESVYGVRGLVGSVSEHVAERVAPDSNMFFVRGGNFHVTDERDFRAATRNQHLPYDAWKHVGFRLVVDLSR